MLATALMAESPSKRNDRVKIVSGLQERRKRTVFGIRMLAILALVA